MKKIIRIEPANTKQKQFSINWMLHDRCTYDCSYCPPDNKKGNDDWLKITFSKQFVDKLDDWLKQQGIDNVAIHFTGGEPTVWPRFIELVDYINEKGWQIRMTTNGSRSLSWWEDNCKKFHSISMSYHSEGADIDEFIEKCKLISKHVLFHVGIMMNPTKWKEATEVVRRLKPTNIRYTVRPLQRNFGLVGIDIPEYSEEQLSYIKNYRVPLIKKLIWYAARFSLTIFKQKQPIPEYVFVDEQLKRHHLYPNELVLNNQVNFYNWKCNAGLDQIFINSLGQIYGGTCLQGPLMGNIQEPDNIKWAEEPITCKSLHCGCYADIKITKWKTS